MNNYKVYCLTNTITDEKYIGVTKQKMYKRFKNGKGYKPTTKINLAIQKFGWENFNYQILYETENKELAGMIEEDYIKKYDTIKHGYNMQSGGFKNFKGVLPSEETKNKMKKTKNGKHYSPNTEFKKGTLTEYTKNKMIKVLCVETGKIYNSINQAEKELNISHHIWDCINNKRQKCGGYHWIIVGGDN